MTAIVARGLTRLFPPDIRAVDGIDLDVPEGQVFGFLGPNGSGKTTTVRMLTTLLKPSAGTAVVGGLDVQKQAAVLRRSIGVALQEVGLDDFQTGRELLTLQARLLGVPPGEARSRVSELLDVVTLSDAADRPVKGYSGGMKRRLDLACALVHRPRIVFLDEPTTGLDPITRESVWKYVTELNKGSGVTFFLTTQYMDEADRLADEIAIMDRGTIVARGTPAALKASMAADAISVNVQGGQDPKLAEELLRRFPGTEDVRVAGHEVTMYVKDGASAVASVVLALDEAGLKVENLRLTHPTLDDVFLRATGHRLEADGSYVSVDGRAR